MRHGAWARHWPWAPLAVAAAYVAVLLVRLTDVVYSVNLNADAVSAPVIGELLGSGGHGREVVLGNLSWYETLWFEQLTKGFPHHRQIWELGPYALALCGFALVAWMAWRVAGRWAAMVTATVLVCAGPLVLQNLVAGSIHGPSWFHMALAGALVIFLTERAERLGPAVMLAAIAVVGAITAAGVASDDIVYVNAVGPMVLAAGAAPWLIPRRPGRRVAFTLVATAAVAVIGGAIATSAMRDAGFRAHDFGLVLASGERVAGNLHLLGEALAVMANGNFFNLKPGIESGTFVALAAIGLAAVIACWRFVWRFVRDEVVRDRTIARAAPLRSVYVVFWGAAGGLVLLAYVLSSAPLDITSFRYIVGVAYAVAALLPLIATRHPAARVAVVAGVTIFAASSTWLLARGDATSHGNFPDAKVANGLLELAQQEHLKVGYAGYWDAAALTWGMHARVNVFPIMECRTAAGPRCPFTFHRVSKWYDERPGQRSFLVVDPKQPFVTQPDPGFGKPDRVQKVDRVVVYIYDHDIARELQFYNAAESAPPPSG